MTSLPDYQIQYTKYKWEFLRRNSRYQRDWDELQEIIEVKYNGAEPENGVMHMVEMQFCDKWKIAKPLSPYASYDDYTKLTYIPEQYDANFYIELAPGDGVLSNYGVDVPRLLFEWLNPGFYLNPAFDILDGWVLEFDGGKIPQSIVSNSLSETGKLTIRVDLNYSKSRLAKEFKILLDDWKVLYEDAYKKRRYKELCSEKNIISHPADEDLKNELIEICNQEFKQRTTKYEKKYYFDNFETYLQVYDLRKSSKSWSEIKTALNLNSIQTARNHYKAACRIIERGIDYYVK